MSSFRRVVLLTLAITPSGALSPGPLSASAVALGALMGVSAGFLAALGHMVVELPYVLALYRFTGLFRGVLSRFKPYFNMIVVLFLLYFAYLLLQDSLRITLGSGGSSSSSLIVGEGFLGAFITGAFLTGFNVYFLLWWLTVGYPLIEESSRLGALGFAVMYATHVWVDYVWLAFLAGGGGAVRLLGSMPYALLLGALAVVLLLFASRIAVDTCNILRSKGAARETS